MKSYVFLFWGYLVVWIGLMIYFITLGQRVASVAKRLDSLEARSKSGDAPRAT